jgi:hypothetical protein
VNVEAGTDEEENRTNQVIDRVNVTGTVWLGTTLECCQCHNHKYDPFTQRDYYQLFAFFNNAPKETYQRSKGSASLDFGGPEVKLPADPAVEKERSKLTEQHAQIAGELENCLAEESTGLAAWEREMADPEKAKEAKLPANIARLLAAKKRNERQKTQLRNYFISIHPQAKKIQTRMDGLQKQIDALAPPASLVMQELQEPRMTAIFERGSFLSPGAKVEPGTPAELPPLAGEAPRNRLGLAQWLVDAANPLTPRVQVNRAWAAFFGRGIVASEEDLGTQAEEPTHPALLDWLAVELRDRGWSRKRVHRRIVESATYRQDSRWRSDLASRDPENKLLARGARFRLAAELVRDNALAASGELSSKMHGPPVYPPQPDGVWRVTGAVDNTYRTSQGDDARRRGLYTVRRRSAPYPSFSNFDAPDRSACTVKRPESNTPLQALTLLNDPVYVELARGLADRVVKETAGRSLDEQLVFAFRAVLARQPEGEEQATLRTIFEQARRHYAADVKAAKKIAAKRDLPAAATATEWSAWFDVAHVLLNLDEAITKN